MPKYDEFSGLDQVTHATGALFSVNGPAPAPKQHLAESLRSRSANHNSLEFANRSTRKVGTPPMGPGAVTAATPNPTGYHTPPGYDQNGPPPGPMAFAMRPQSTGAKEQAAQHAQVANQYAAQAAQLRAVGRHRDAATAETSAQAHAAVARDLSSQSSTSNAGSSGSSKGTAMNQPSLRNVDPDHYFEQPLGFVQKAIATVTAASAISKPQAVFRPTRLSIPSAIVAFFTVQNIRIGTDSQLVGTTEMPAQVYSELAVGSAFLLGTANIGIEVSLDVTNIDTVTHDFRAVMFGQTFK